MRRFFRMVQRLRLPARLLDDDLRRVHTADYLRRLTDRAELARILEVGIVNFLPSRFTDWQRRPLSAAQIEYAIGDVTRHQLLAHVASHQGVVAVERMAGQERRMDYNQVPACTFTHPEVASRAHRSRVLHRQEYEDAGWHGEPMTLGKPACGPNWGTRRLP